MANERSEIPVEMDANTAQIRSAFEYIQSEIDKVKRAVQGIGFTSADQLKKAGMEVSTQLRQLNSLQKQMSTLTRSGLGYDEGKKQLESAKGFFRLQEAERKESIKRQAAVEREGAKLFADINKAEINRQSQASKLAAKARIDETRAQIAENARLIESMEKLKAVRADSSARLTGLRAQARQEMDPNAARAIATRIQMEKLLGTELNKRERQLESLEKTQGKQTNATFKQVEAEAALAAKMAVQRNKDYSKALAQVRSVQPKLTEDQMWAPIERKRSAAEIYGEKAVMAMNAAAMSNEKQQIDSLRTLRTAATRDQLEQNRAVRAARLDATKADMQASAAAITNERELSAARAANIEKLRQYRAAQKTETNPQQLRALQALIALEKSYGDALNKTARDLEGRNRSLAAPSKTEKLLIPGNVRDLAIRTGDPKNVLFKMQTEQELARQQLLKAVGAEQIAQAQRRLELANASVNAAERLVREEEKILAAERAINSTNRSEAQRTQVALAGAYAKEQIATLGPTEAINRAVRSTVAAQEALNNASKNGTVQMQQQAREALKLAQAQETAVKSQVNQQKGALGNILSPGYAAAAFARTAIYGTAAGAAYGAFNAVQNSAQGVVELEDELQKLQAISNSTDGEMQQLKASIFAIGDGSRYAVNDLVKISQTLAQAGISAAEMENVLKAVTTLATSSGSTPDEAVNLVTAALGSFQLQGTEAARVADLMTNALNRTKLTVQQVGQAIQYVGATAYEQNISLETLLGTIGAVAQGGVKAGSTIGTGFRQFLVDLQTPTEKLRFELDRLGITQGEVDVKTRGLAAVLETLKRKGFGATEAYSGMETRAAAFYLVAKNNTDVMEELQLSFAMQGAAAIANERAMNSVTAQWQRFKNVLQEGLAKDLEEPMIMLKQILKALSDRILEMRDAAQKMNDLRAENDAKYGTGLSGFMNRPDPWNYDLNNAVEGGLNRLDQLFTNAEDRQNRYLAKGKLLGEWMYQFGRETASTSSSVEAYGESINRASQEVDGHGNTIVALDKEMERLKTQQKDLIGNTRATQAETITLTSRFQGLAGYLGTLKDGYLDLIAAMNSYRGEESRLLGQAYAAQVAAQQKQNNLDQSNLTSTVNKIKGNSELMRSLTPNERAVLDNPNAAKFPQMMADAAARVAKSNTDLGNVLNDAATYAGRLAVGTRTAQRNRDLGGVATAASTPLGISATAQIGTYQQRIDALDALGQADRKKQAGPLTGSINNSIKELTGRLASVKEKGNRDFLTQSIDTLKGMLAQIASALKPTAAELKDAKAAAAEQRRQEAELRKRPKIKQSDIDAVGAGLGLTLGSGVRSKAEQNELHRRGLTPATGDTSSHSNGGIARDFRLPAKMSDDEARRLAATMRAQYAAKGIEAFVQFESGKGKNQGSGRHIHVNTRAGATLSKDRSETNEDQYQAELSQGQVDLAERNLRIKLKGVAASASKETFNASVEAASAALDALNEKLMTAALDELASKGIAQNSDQGVAKIEEVKDKIAQNIEDFNQKITDQIIKSVDKQLAAADLAFQKATQKARDFSAIADARASGLGYASNAGKVPEYVNQNAQRTAALAKENVDRATLAALPDRISATKTQIEGLIQGGDFSDATATKIEELTKAVADLEAQRAALAAGLGAGGLVPTTIGQGLDQAIAAYTEANQLGRSFKDTVIFNLGEGVETVHQGFNTFFSDIFTGSKSALGAFANFAMGMIRWMEQLAAQYVATQVFNQLLSLAGLAVGSTSGGGGFGSGAAPFSGPGLNPSFAFNGGAPANGLPGYVGGGRVMNGSPLKDSVNARIAKDEWVVRKKAVDSVGHKFMADLNANGASALKAQANGPVIEMPKQQVGVYVTMPGRQPQMGKNDILLTIQEDMLSGGETAKLVKMVSNG